MDIILFRAKREDTKEWVYGYLIARPAGYGSHFYILTPAPDQEQEPQEVKIYFPTAGQFTGLIDKNNKERYEGDIIRRATGWVFVEEKKVYRLGSEFDAKVLGYDYHPEDEIIGNKYDNPELLNFSQPEKKQGKICNEVVRDKDGNIIAIASQ